MKGFPTSKKLLITGACSYVGLHLIKYLRENGFSDNIIACCRNQEKAEALKNDNITVVTSNLLSPGKYEQIFENHKPDFVIHLAAVARFKQGEENPGETIKANFLGSIKLIELAEKHNVERFLYVSSNLARNPKGITGYSKYLTEAFIKRMDSKMKVVSIRLPNVIDSPGAVTLIFKRQIENGEPITITDRRMSRKFITPEAAAGQLIFALLHGEHKDIFINNRPSTPIVELAKEMIAKSNKEIAIKFIGMRPGEKLEEDDYPSETIKPTEHKELFVLTENQHCERDIEIVINNVSRKVKPELTLEIKKSFQF